MAEKSHDLGGRRSQARHNFENAGASGLVWFVLNRIDSLDSAEKTALMGFLVVALSALAKAWSDHRLTSKLLAKAGLGGIVLVALSGCAISLGEIEPHEFEGSNGETIIACSVRGVQLAAGDGGVCSNVEGGRVSDAFAWLVTSVVEGVGRVLGAVLSPFGAIGAAGDALRAPTAPSAPPPPPPAPPLFAE